jgi:hypothetical protein
MFQRGRKVKEGRRWLRNLRVATLGVDGTNDSRRDQTKAQEHAIDHDDHGDLPGGVRPGPLMDRVGSPEEVARSWGIPAA